MKLPDVALSLPTNVMDLTAWLRSGCPLVFHGGQKIFAHKEQFQSYFFKDTPFPILIPWFSLILKKNMANSLTFPDFPEK